MIRGLFSPQRCAEMAAESQWLCFIGQKASKYSLKKMLKVFFFFKPGKFTFHCKRIISVVHGEKTKTNIKVHGSGIEATQIIKQTKL